jgi:prepilin peptidase CpaA
MNAGIPNALPDPLQAALFALVIAAAIYDLAARRIPNGISLAGLAVGLALNGYFAGWPGLGSSLLGGLLGAAIFLGLYVAGGMGAGDVKLFAAVGAMVGPQPLLLIFVLTGLAGGMAALALIVVRGRAGEKLRSTLALAGSMLRLNWNEVSSSSDRGVPGAICLPYGAVVAVGTLVFLLTVRHVNP